MFISFYKGHTNVMKSHNFGFMGAFVVGSLLKMCLFRGSANTGQPLYDFFFQTGAKISAFYLEKQKSFILKKLKLSQE